jgi:hypothetical protein
MKDITGERDLCDLIDTLEILNEAQIKIYREKAECKK